jgi:hypothetical protein
MSNSNRSNSNSSRTRKPVKQSAFSILTDDEKKAKRSAATKLGWANRAPMPVPPPHGTESQMAVVNKMVRRLGTHNDGQLVGLDRQLHRLSSMIKKPEANRLSTSLHEQDSRMLLYGPPGNGKTALVREAAAAAEATFFAPSADQFCSTWSGESEGIIATLFDEAVRRSPAVIFIDEIDSIGRQRDFSGNSRHTEPQTVIVLLQKMDELKTEYPDAQVCLVAATNHIEALDIALIRRFPKPCYVGRPSPQQRVETIRRMFVETGTPLHLELADAQWLANHTGGFSFSEVADLVKEAASLCLEEVDVTDKTAILHPTNIRHFKEALTDKTAIINLKEDLIKRQQEDLRRSTTDTEIVWHHQHPTNVPIQTTFDHHQHHHQHQTSSSASFTSTASLSFPRPGEKRIRDQDEEMIDFYERNNDPELSHICEIATELRQSEPSNQTISSSFLPPRTVAPMKKQTTQPIQYIQIPSERYLAFQRYEEQQRDAPESPHPMALQTPQLQISRPPTPKS